MAPLLSSLTLLVCLASSVLCSAHPKSYGQPLTSQQLQAKQPLNGLPSNSQYSLVYTTLGIGHQNYTCSNGVYVQTEEGDGLAKESVVLCIPLEQRLTAKRSLIFFQKLGRLLFYEALEVKLTAELQSDLTVVVRYGALEQTALSERAKTECAKRTLYSS